MEGEGRDDACVTVLVVPNAPNLTNMTFETEVPSSPLARSFQKGDEKGKKGPTKSTGTEQTCGWWLHTYFSACRPLLRYLSPFSFLLPQPPL